LKRQNSVLRRSVISVAASRETVSWPLPSSASAFAITPASSLRAGPGGRASRMRRASLSAVVYSCRCAYGSDAARARTGGASSRVRCGTGGSAVREAGGSRRSRTMRALPSSFRT
jgi:hypothetical protein